jgi:pimeloyl-ACP methyl ester carboxylesterase
VKLAGTLTVPRDKKPAPAVILITGSGAQDRDESLMGHKPFLVLADHLTRKGIAVLRVDDRGVGGSSGSPNDSTTLDFAKDVRAGVDFLKQRPEVDKTRIGLIGHSEGGIIAPIVASQSQDIAFIVLMAATGVIGEQVLLEQSAALILAGSGTQEMVKKNQEAQRRIFELVRTEKDRAVMKTKLEEVAGAQGAAAATPWFGVFLTLDPAEYLRKVSCPVLVVQGELDRQVIASQNVPPIAKALEQAGNRDYTIVKLPRLNHLFQTATSGTPSEYAKIDETIAPVALDTMSDWIIRHTK